MNKSMLALGLNFLPLSAFLLGVTLGRMVEPGEFYVPHDWAPPMMLGPTGHGDLCLRCTSES
jgi:hypothetical protein